MRWSSGFRAVALLLVFGLAIELNRHLERRAVALPLAHSIYLPAGKYLRYASLGHAALAADLLYIWSIQYYSTDRPDRWQHLAQFYDVIADLDPAFVAAYLTGALILAIEAGDRKAALALLDRGIAANPASFELPFEAAHYARELQDFDRATSYFRRAKDQPGAPAFVRRWYLFSLDRSGRREDALALWRQMRAEAASDYERTVADRYIHDLTLDIQLDAVRAAVAAFTARNGRPPVALDELVKRGDLTSEPEDPDGNPFLYDRRTGEVKAESSFLLQHRLAR